MQTVIIVIHLMIVATLIGVVLLQRSEGGGLGVGGGGGGGFMSSRGTTNLLTRTTAILAAGFFITSLFLSWLASYERKPASILNPWQSCADLAARRRAAGSDRRSARLAQEAGGSGCTPRHLPHRRRRNRSDTGERLAVMRKLLVWQVSELSFKPLTELTYPSHPQRRDLSACAWVSFCESHRGDKGRVP